MRILTDAWRGIRRAPLVSAVIVLSLAAGIGINAVIFSWVQSRIFRPLPGVPGSGAFLGIEARTERGGYPATSWPEYRDLAERLRSFDAIVASQMVPIFVGRTGEVERVYGLVVSENYFDVLRTAPAAGRLPTAAEMSAGRSQPLAVIGYGLWQSRYGGDPAVVGSPIRLNGVDATIAGVTSRIFQGTVLGLNFEVFVPAGMTPLIAPGSRGLEDRSARDVTLLGRLRDGVSREAAQHEAAAVMADLATTYPATNAGIGAEVAPYWYSPRGPQRAMVAGLLLLQALMLIVLLTICSNTANLVLARSSARHREMGIRLALGAGPARVMRLLLAETTLLGLLGAALGALVAVWGAEALKLIPLTGLPIRMETYVDGTTLLVAMLLGAGAGALVGAAPAAHFARLDPMRALRAGGRDRARTRLRTFLMAAQVGLAVIVLIGAAIVLRSFLDTRTMDPKFERDGVLLAAYDLEGRNKTADQARQFAAGVLDRLQAVPSVESAAISSLVPLDIHGLPNRVFTLEGHTRLDEGADRALTNIVTPGYFRLMRIALVGGRDFSPLIDEAAAPEAIVNETFAARFAAGRPVIGRRLEIGGRAFRIAGVAADSTYDAFGEPPTPALYVSYRDWPVSSGEIHVRVRGGDEARAAADIRAAVAAVEPDFPVFNVRTLRAHVESNLMFRSIPARMFMLLAPLLLALIAIGIYAVVAYGVTLRTMEIGLRMALGATRRQVERTFVRQSMRAIVIGAAVGLALAAVAGARLLDGQLWDPVIFVVVPAFLLLVAAAACWLPARRAAGADPWTALRTP